MQNTNLLRNLTIGKIGFFVFVLTIIVSFVFGIFFWVREFIIQPQIFAFVANPGMESIKYGEYLEYMIDKNIFNKIGFLAPVILAVFSGVFLLFTYITKQNLEKAEALIAEINTKNEIRQTQEADFKKEVEGKLQKIENVTSEWIESLDTYPRKFTDAYKQLLFLFYPYLPDEHKVSALEVSYLVNLFDERFAIKGTLFLSQQGSEKCLPFLKEAKVVYLNHEQKEIAKQIDFAIQEIEKRTLGKNGSKMTQT